MEWSRDENIFGNGRTCSWPIFKQVVDTLVALPHGGVCRVDGCMMVGWLTMFLFALQSVVTVEFGVVQSTRKR